ncbi:DUF1616 domain-containing protein [Haloferax gibbonsii]|uniref:DUF1616 domain-containing protein n=1 Tax=Haloferax gibbonsii TaxID=35746 RepID=A0A0K1IYH3_HALGI|nr:DUF1616 domain-containing protein [Haloferax gibbonsii]AKU09516.1 hypothetical protein ABY42_17030 [Haloferax gibbonsii]
MKSSTRLWTLDVLLVVAGSIAALAVVMLDLSGSVVRSLFVVPLIVLYPGYALLAAVFPERRSDVESDTLGDESALTRPTRHTAGLLYSVRLVLSAALSLALVAAVALVTNLVGRGFDASIVALGVFGVTMLFTAVAVARRMLLPPDARAGAPPLSTVLGSVASTAGAVTSPLSSESRSSPVSLAVNLLVVVSVVAFLSSVGFAMVETQAPESDFTEAYLVTQNGSDYEASGYPQQLSPGESVPVTLALENHEHESTTYTVVTELQRLDRTPNGTRVVEERELDRTRASVGDNETAYVQQDVRPTMSGESLRLVYHVYKGDAPDDANRENSYRTVQLVVSVGDGGGGDNTAQLGRPDSIGGASA